MVSKADARPMNDDDVSMDTVIPKTEPTQDGNASMSESVSTPEPEEQNQDVAQTQKRKGGRKPVRLFYPTPPRCYDATMLMLA